MWFNNVTVNAAYDTNGWNVYEFVTKNGHKVRGISKFEMKKVISGDVVNVLINNKAGATYVTSIVTPKAKVA